MFLPRIIPWLSDGDESPSPSKPSVLPDLAVAKEATLASFALYCGNLDASLDCFWCKKLAARAALRAGFVGRFGRGVAQGFVAVDQAAHVVWVVFRGTDSPAGWVKNLHFAKKAYKKGRVHAGFLSAYTAVAQAVLRLARQGLTACGADCSMVVAGHSLVSRSHDCSFF